MTKCKVICISDYGKSEYNWTLKQTFTIKSWEMEHCIQKNPSVYEWTGASNAIQSYINQGWEVMQIAPGNGCVLVYFEKQV